VRSAAEENDHEEEKHDYQARPGQRPAASPELGLRTIAGVAALWWLADPVLSVVKGSHLRDSTLNRRAGGQLGNQLAVLQPLGATSSQPGDRRPVTVSDRCQHIVPVASG
jgi:hypothetical protein